MESDDDSVRIEGIEDVDKITSGIIEAVQCKYYSGTKCVPSVVGKAIRPMLRHFADHKDDSVRYKYSLYAHYNSGQDTIMKPLTVEYVKQKFFSYKEKEVEHVLHNELGLSDEDLSVFIKRLNLQLYAESYDDQICSVKSMLKNVIGCTEYEASYFYYNNAVSFVKSVAVKKSAKSRTVTKKQFLNKICKKRALFDSWYFEYIGFQRYYRDARRAYFTKQNISPCNRFFVIECDSIITDADLTDVIMTISEKWSRLSPREKNPFCPYICIHGLPSFRLANLKHLLLENDFHIRDGFEFKDAQFSLDSLVRPVNHHVGVKARIINKLSQINEVIMACNGSKEIYQFYLQKPVYKREGFMGAEFKIQKTSDVKSIV